MRFRTSVTLFSLGAVLAQVECTLVSWLAISVTPTTVQSKGTATSIVLAAIGAVFIVYALISYLKSDLMLKKGAVCQNACLC